MKIALVHNNNVLAVWEARNGVLPIRYSLPDGSQVSPIQLGWSNGDYAVLELQPFTVPTGKTTTGSPIYIIENNVVIENYDVEDIPEPEPTRRKIRKSTIQARLIDAGLMEAAYTALTSNPIYFARWFAPDQPEVYADDPDALMLLASIGADSEIIMGEDS